MNNINFDIIIKSQSALASLNRIQKSADTTRKRFRDLNRALGQNIKTTKLQADTNNRAGTSFSKLTKQIALGNIAARAITRSFTSTVSLLKNAGVAAISSAANFERLRVQFEVLTQSTSTANDLFQDLVDFSARTPFRLSEIADASQKLLAFGFSAEETKVQVRQLGDVAGATGSKLPEVARIIGQIRSAGRLTGERNLQLLERGIVLYPELARVIGVSESALEGLQKQGRITFEDVNKALQNLTSEGGTFFEGTIKLARTASGVFSTVQDNIELVGAAIGDKLLPFLKFAGIEIIRISQGVLAWVNANITLQGTLNFVSDTILALAFATSIAVRAFSGFRIAAAAVQAVIETGMNVALKLALTSVHGLTAGLALLVGAFSSEKGAKIQAFADQIDNFRNGISITEPAKKFAEDTAKIANDADKLANDIQDAGIRLNTSLAGFVNTPGSTTENPTSNTGSAGGDGNQAGLDSEKRFQDQLMKLREDAALAQRELEVQKELEAGIRDETRLANLQAQFGSEEAIRFEARLREQEGTQEQILTLQEIKASAARQEVEDRQATNKFLMDLDEELGKMQIANAKKVAEEKRRTQLQTIDQTANMFSSLAQLAGAGSKKAFRIQKALNIAQVISSGIASFMRSQELPYPANIPAGIASVATSAAALQRARSTRAPSFENGGIVPGTGVTGDNTVANVNAGEMILNRRQQSNLFSQISGGATTMNSNVVVEIDGEAIGKAVSKQVANGLQLGEVT